MSGSVVAEDKRRLAAGLKLWHKTAVPIFIERFLLPAFAGLLVTMAFANVVNLDCIQRVTLGIALVALALFAAQSLHRYNQSLNESAKPPQSLPESTKIDPAPSPTAGAVIPSPSASVAPQLTTTPSPSTTPASPPAQHTSTPESTRLYPGTDLVGISGTGVTANVIVGLRYTFSGNATVLSIKNTSKSGTITNIGFLIKTQGAPSWAGKREDDNGVTGPGTYRLLKERWEIKTRDFEAVSAFGLVTANLDSDAVAQSFQNGFVSSGIPPGKTTWFALTGFVFNPPLQLERGIIIRFQAIGEEDRADIAMYPKLDVLLPSATESSIYEIQRINKNN